MNRSDLKEGPTGLVLEIQRMSTEDGPGIRTTVFFKGCSLRCDWCHNPESISPKPQLQWIGSRCIGCRTCLEACPNGCLELSEKGMIIDRDRCLGCGTCADECPSTALELMGRSWTVSDLAREVAKDRAYFARSGGGVTVSGGEVGLQAAFVSAFLAACRADGLSTAADTCGYIPANALESLARNADLVLYDLKEIDRDRHKAFTGHDNDLVLENLVRLRVWMDEGRTQNGLWVRTPIIPGRTDRQDNLWGIGRFIADRLAGRIDRWELCAFNNLCRDKYTRLGRTWSLAEAELIPEETMETLADAARRSGVDPSIVFWSGATRLKKSDNAKPGPDLKLLKGGLAQNQGQGRCPA